MISLRVHSLVDVITNSSTVIYTYCDSCVGPAKELINEFLKAMNITDKTADDMFSFGVFLSDYSDYFEHEYDENTDVPEEIRNNEISWKEQKAFLESIIEKVVLGEIKRPAWMTEVEGHENYNGYHYSTAIEIAVKDPKYQAIADAIQKLIFSVDNEACNDN